jgi:hypothetical protein
LQRWAYVKVVDIFGADLRSLATFRIVLALLALTDLTIRATDLFSHYTDAGVMPRADLVQEVLGPWSFSLNLLNGQPFFQALLFAVGMLAALGVLVGYRTRLMVFVVWVVLLSVQVRNPLVNGSESPFLRMLYFWAILLPLGACWSVDRVRSSLPRPSPRFISLATFGLFLQIAFVYWFTAALKSGPEWRVDHTALYYALSLDQLATPIGHYLLGFPGLLGPLTFGTFLLEAIGPILLFCPFFTGPVRTGAALAFMSLHFGIWLTMDIGIFPWVSAFCMVCFFPTWFWDRASALYSAMSRRSGLVPRVRLAVSRLAGAIVGLAGTISSFLADVRQILFTSPGPDGGSLAVQATVPPPATGTGMLREEEPVENPAPSELRSSLATNLLAFFFIFYILCWNLTTVSSLTLPERTVPLGPFLGIDQYWGMFAPSPSKEDGWFVIPGDLQDGRKVDLMPITRDDYGMHGVSFEKPRDIPATYKNEHWRKYLENIYNQDHADQRLYFGQYICRQWNSRHLGAESLDNFRIIYMREATLPDYQRSQPEKVNLWNHTC